MEPGDIKAYAERDWASAERLKSEHWAREHHQRGPEATIAASLALWRHMRLVRPDWPTDEDRRQDLAHHVALKQLIDRAARVFSTTAAR